MDFNYFFWSRTRAVKIEETSTISSTCLMISMDIFSAI